MASLEVVARVGPTHPCPDIDDGDRVEAVEEHAGVDHGLFDFTRSA
ncbi:hypothetical protein [uncultured Ilumatobacter sp.]